jgi:hypothetical protein
MPTRPPEEATGHFKVKAGGSYSCALSVSHKANGAYSPIGSVYVKVGDNYQSVSCTAPPPCMTLEAHMAYFALNPFYVSPCSIGLTWAGNGINVSCSDSDVYAIQTVYQGETYTLVWVAYGSGTRVLTSEDTTYSQLLVGSTLGQSFVPLDNSEFGNYHYWNIEGVREAATQAFCQPSPPVG